MLRATLLIICVAVVVGTDLCFSQTLFGQTPQKTADRTKTFGHSIRADKSRPDQRPLATSAKNIDHDTIRVRTDLVVADVLVLNTRGNAVLGLKQTDFLVKESGDEKKVEYFAGTGAAAPRSIVLIVDYSYSMLPFIRDSVAAAKVMIDKLGPEDCVAIVTDDVQLLTDFTTDKQRLKQTLDNIALSASYKIGLSLQFSSLVATLQELFNEENVRPTIILQSDGDEYWSFKPSQTRRYSIPPKSQIRAFGCNGLCQSVAFDDVYALVAGSRATIYSIVPGYKLLGLSQDEQKKVVGEKFYRRFPQWPRDRATTPGYLHDAQEALFDLSAVSGGYMDFVQEPGDADSVYTTLFQTMSSRYAVGYYAEAPGSGSSWKTVEITVRNHPEYVIVGRKRFLLKD